jgi:hypothetical protein
MNWVFISKKTPFFIVTPVKTSNVTKHRSLLQTGASTSVAAADPPSVDATYDSALQPQSHSPDYNILSKIPAVRVGMITAI